jgi:hypothetical protein
MQFSGLERKLCNICLCELNGQSSLIYSSQIKENIDEKTLFDLLFNYYYFIGEFDKGIDLTKKIDGDEKYLTLLYATPYILRSNGKDYLLLSKNTADSESPYYETWVITDTEGNIIKDNIPGEDATLENISLQVGYDTDSYQKVFDLSDLKIDGESVSLKESKYDDPYYLLKKRAGIYK